MARGLTGAYINIHEVFCCGRASLAAKQSEVGGPGHAVQ